MWLQLGQFQATYEADFRYMQPYFNPTRRNMEDNLNIFEMEDDLNVL